MEDYWKDFNLISLPNTPHALPPLYHNTNQVINHTNYPNIIRAPNNNNNNNNNIYHPITPNTNFRGGRLILPHPSITTTVNHHQGSVLVNDGGGCSSGRAVAKTGSSKSTPENVNVDRKLKRKLQNRDSALRSRARAQARTNELELEVINLKEENCMLRKQVQELELLLAASTQPSKIRSLIRSLSI